MKDLVIFCDNYLHAMRALHLASVKQYDTVTLLVTQYESLFKFFNAVNEKVFSGRLKVVFPSRYVSRVTPATRLKKVWLLARDGIERRRYLNNIYKTYFAGRRGDDIVFGPGYLGAELFLLLKTHKELRWSYYATKIPGGIIQFKPRGIIDWLTILNVKLIYGWPISMMQLAGLPDLKWEIYLPESTLKRKTANYIAPDEAEAMMNDFDMDRFRVFNEKEHSLIYFHDDIIEAPYSGIDEQQANRELEQIFEVIKRHIPEQALATKLTPASAPKPRPQIGELLPSFVPAELLYNDKTAMYLSIFSAAMANVEKGMAVSMADLITFKDNATKDALKQSLLQRARSKILFPSSLEELEQIIITLKQASML